MQVQFVMYVSLSKVGRACRITAVLKVYCTHYPQKERQKETDAAKSKREIRVPGTDSTSLQHVQRSYAVHQLVQYRRRDLFYLDGDQTVRSDPPICRHIAEVRGKQQRTEWLSQSGDDSEGPCLFVRLR